MNWAVFRNTDISDKYFRFSNCINTEQIKEYYTKINEYYDVKIFDGIMNENTGKIDYKMDAYYELLRISRKNKNKMTNIPIYVYGFHKGNDVYKSDLDEEDMFLKATFIQQISDGKIIVKDDVIGLDETTKNGSINWKKILE